VNQGFSPSGKAGAAVPLAPGATAHADLLLAQASFYNPKTCVPVQVGGFRIVPPGGKTAVFVSSPQKACSAKGTGVGQVGPVTAGAGQSVS
jgi:Protein of unknown function (DUF4232)